MMKIAAKETRVSMDTGSVGGTRKLDLIWIMLKSSCRWALGTTCEPRLKNSILFYFFIF